MGVGGWVVEGWVVEGWVVEGWVCCSTMIHNRLNLKVICETCLMNPLRVAR